LGVGWMRSLELICRSEEAQWCEPITSEVWQELVGWFDHGWSVQALLVASDRRPDNVFQRRRRTREELRDYVQRRMRFWFDDSLDADSVSSRLKPPHQGQTLGQWLVVRLRNDHRSALRAFRPLSGRGHEAWQRALDHSRSKISPSDRVARARASDVKRQAAMDLLAPNTRRPDNEVLTDLTAYIGFGEVRNSCAFRTPNSLLAFCHRHDTGRSVGVDRCAAAARPS
jgi:hypothetical protein